jgi:hypothetical protein
MIKQKLGGESMGVCLYDSFSLWILCIGNPTNHRFIVMYLESYLYCRITRGIIIFLEKKIIFLGHHEEEKKKISHRIFFWTQFLKKKPEKKENKSRNSPFKVFSCVCVGVGSRSCKIIPCTFSSFVLVEQNRHALVYPPQAYLRVAREVDRWLEKTPP